MGEVGEVGSCEMYLECWEKYFGQMLRNSENLIVFLGKCDILKMISQKENSYFVLYLGL